jgi:hypothetical protein
MPAAERAAYSEMVLARRLREALTRLKPALPTEALENAFRKLTRPESGDLVQRNRRPSGFEFAGKLQQAILTVSLGEPHDGYCYKLIAAIMERAGGPKP